MLCQFDMEVNKIGDVRLSRRQEQTNKRNLSSGSMDFIQSLRRRGKGFEVSAPLYVKCKG